MHFTSSLPRFPASACKNLSPSKCLFKSNCRGKRPWYYTYLIGQKGSFFSYHTHLDPYILKAMLKTLHCQEQNMLYCNRGQGQENLNDQTMLSHSYSSQLSLLEHVAFFLFHVYPASEKMHQKTVFVLYSSATSAGEGNKEQFSPFSLTIHRKLHLQKAAYINHEKTWGWMIISWKLNKVFQVAGWL